MVIEEGTLCEIREGTFLLGNVVSSSVLPLGDMFELSEKFRPWTVLFLDFENWREKVIVQSIDYFAREITIDKTVSYVSWTKIWQLLFGWVITNAPQEEISRWSCDPILSHDVQVSNRRALFDRKVVVQTYEDVYPREIFWRIIYEFCANDTTTILEDFETVGIWSGVVSSVVIDDQDRIQGTYCNVLGFYWAWTGTLRFDFPAKDISNEKKMRFFRKIKEDDGIKMQDFVCVVWWATRSATYQIKNFWKLFENCRNLETMTINEPISTVWTIDFSSVEFVEFTRTMTAGTSVDAMRIDIMQAFTWWFSLQNTMRGDIPYTDFRVQYKKPSIVFENLTKMTNDYRHIDYERDLHYYSKLWSELAPFDITSTSQNFGNLKIDYDITTIKNRQTVRWWEAPDQNLYTQDEVCDWEEDSFRLDYKPKDLRIFLDYWAWFIEESVWVENLADEANFQWIFNFNEKVIRKWWLTPSAPTAWVIFRRVYLPYRAIRVRVQDNDSIARMKLLTKWDGIYDGAVIVEPKIRTFQEARIRAKSEVDAYKNPTVSFNFDTNFDGLHPGQLITINDPDRWVSNEQYLIQSVSYSSRNDDYRTYRVQASTTLFWLTEFFQLLLKKSDRREVDASELVDIVQNVDEVIVIEDDIVPTVSPDIFTAWSIEEKRRDFKHQRFHCYNLESSNNQKSQDWWYIENKWAWASGHHNVVFDDPILFVETRKGKPQNPINNEIFFWYELGTNKLFASHIPVDDKEGNTQRAMEITNGYIQCPTATITTPDEITILIDTKPNQTTGERVIFSWRWIVVSITTTQVIVYPNDLQPPVIFPTLGNWSRYAVQISFDDDFVRLWKNGKVIDEIPYTGPKWSWPQPVLWAYKPNVDNREYDWTLAELQVYDRLLTDREVAEWVKWYTDRYWLTLNNKTTNIHTPNAWTWCKVKPSTTYDLSLYFSILHDLQNIWTDWWLLVRVVGYNDFHLGWDTDHTIWSDFVFDYLDEKTEKTDRKRELDQITTEPTTNYIAIGIYLKNATWSVRVNDIRLRERGTETEPNPCIADYAQVA